MCAVQLQTSLATLEKRLLSSGEPPLQDNNALVWRELSSAVAYRDILKEIPDFSRVLDAVNNLFQEMFNTDKVLENVSQIVERIEREVRSIISKERDKVRLVDLQGSTAQCVSDCFFEIFPKVTCIRVCQGQTNLIESLNRNEPQQCNIEVV